MIKTLTVLEKIKESREYRLILSPDSPLGECFDVLTEMRADILKMINDSQKPESQEESNE